MKTPGEALDKNGSAEVNFKVLKRKCPSMEKIVATAGHSTLYIFLQEEKTWSQSEVEGSFFLIQNQGQMSYQFVILNQKGANYFENIGQGFRLEQVTSKKAHNWLFYRTQKNEVLGVYFYNPEECAKIFSILTELINAMGITGAQNSQTLSQQPASTPEHQGQKNERRKSLQVDGADKGDSPPHTSAASRPPDASPIQINHARSAPPTSSQKSFFDTFGNKQGNPKQITPSQQPLRSAGLPPVNHAENLETLRNLPPPATIFGDPEKNADASKTLFRPQAGQPSHQGLNGGLGSATLRKTEPVASASLPVKQQLLKPDFFQNALSASKLNAVEQSGSQSREQSTTASDLNSARQPTAEQQRLRNFFISKSKPASGLENARPSESIVAGRPSMHDSVRSVIKELAESDVFIDAIVQQLAKRKLIPDA